MRLQNKGMPNSADRHAAEPAGLSQTAGAPMRLPTRRAFQGLDDNLLHLSIANLARRSRSGFVIESLQSRLQKPRTPLVYHADRTARLFSYQVVSQALGGGQDHTRAPRQHGLAAGSMGQRLKSFLFLRCQNQGSFRASGSHLSLLSLRRSLAAFSLFISPTVTTIQPTNSGLPTTMLRLPTTGNAAQISSCAF